jgi:hypothetical protein
MNQLLGVLPVGSACGKNETWSATTTSASETTTKSLRHPHHSGSAGIFAAIARPIVSARSFGSTMQAVTNDPDGLVLDEGLTTASAGTGSWGDFTFISNYTTKAPGLGRVVV